MDFEKVLSRPARNQVVKLNIEDDALNAYLKRLSKYKPLTKEEEIDLVIRAQNNDNIARKKMINCNLKLVVTVAKKLLHTSKMPIIDLIQEGNLGLMIAIDKFNPKLGYRFSTYATWWIKQSMFKAISEQSHSIKVPVYVQETLNKFSKLKLQLEQKKNCHIKNEDVAKKMHLDLKKMDIYLSAFVKSVSLESEIEIKGGKKVVLSEILEDKKQVLKTDLDYEYLKADIDYVISKLREKERNVITFRYGLNNFAKKTLEEIGKIYGVTKECIRQTEKKAIKHIRENQQSLKLLSSWAL